jgi:glyceraldehyde-3-phosphate dehydrogenase (NADP+)
VAAVRSPFSGQVVAEMAQAGPAEVEQALTAAVAARPALASASMGQRRAVLSDIASRLGERLEEMARAIALEAGKPLTQARLEVRRGIETFTLAAAEVSVGRGEVVPVDLDARSAGYSCVVTRAPAGVVVGISPFNFPLNLAAHKVAPALAVGAPIILKPPPQAPSAALMLAEMAEAAGAPEGALSVLPCGPPVAEALASDPRVRVLSFTGSARVGWHLRDKARAKVVLELGGNAAAIVAADADLAWAAERLALSAFAYAGQVCISTQRIYVDARVREPFTRLLVEQARKLAIGDPLDEATVVGPVIDDGAADRITAWVEEAKARGAQELCGGPHQGRMLAPTLLADAPHDSRVAREEVFGPVALVWGVEGLEQALARVNDSAWGLQASLFTHDLRAVRSAQAALEVGALVVNDSPSFRSDGMPYGGVKGSGLGREGLRYAMEDLTEPRALITARG